MKKCGLILFAFLGFSASMKAQDMQLLTNRQLQGSARYVGMSGAMTAIGGDAGSVLDNPAGLGLYRRFEFTISIDQQWNTTYSLDKLRTWRFSVPQMACVIPFGDGTRQKGMIFNHLMLGYNRTAVYDQSACLPITSGTTTLNSSILDWGYSDNFSVTWATNISNQWYIGLGLNMPTLNYSCTVENQTTYSFQSFSGVGFNASIGVIYRPTQWVRIGVSYVSPSTITLTERDRYGYLASIASVLPMRVSAGVGLQVWQYALVSLQYDYANWKNITDTHTMRIGAEGQVWNHLYLNAGYAHDFLSRSTQYVSGGIGYRAEHLVAHVTYQYMWRHDDQHSVLSTHANEGFASETHRVVVTIGWRN